MRGKYYWTGCYAADCLEPTGDWFSILADQLGDYFISFSGSI